MSGTIIKQDLVIDGNITSSGGSVSVKGKVTGDITAKQVDVAMGGQVNGSVTADTVNIQGQQAGSVKCTELSLGSTSEVKSQIMAQTMTSEKGAKLVGEVQISGG